MLKLRDEFVQVDAAVLRSLLQGHVVGDVHIIFAKSPRRVLTCFCEFVVSYVGFV